MLLGANVCATHSHVKHTTHDGRASINEEIIRVDVFVCLCRRCCRYAPLGVALMMCMVAVDVTLLCFGQRQLNAV